MKPFALDYLEQMTVRLSEKQAEEQLTREENLANLEQPAALLYLEQMDVPTELKLKRGSHIGELVSMVMSEGVAEAEVEQPQKDTASEKASARRSWRISSTTAAASSSSRPVTRGRSSSFNSGLRTLRKSLKLSPRSKPKKPSPRGSPRLSLMDLTHVDDEEEGNVFRHYSRRAVSFARLGRPRYMPALGLPGEKCDTSHCNLVARHKDWLVESHYSLAGTAPKAEQLLFPGQLVLTLDVSSPSCEHFWAVHEQLGPVVVSLDITELGVNAVLWSMHGGLDLAVPAGRVQEAKSRDGRLRVLEDVLEHDCGLLSKDLRWRRVSEEHAEEFARALGLFARRCRTTQVKVGVLLCKRGQTSEREFFDNESTKRFERFLDVLGRKVRLLHFPHFAGGLDTTEDLSGSHSRHGRLQLLPVDFEIMYHVSSYLPRCNGDQQLKRKRHIGNDAVVIVYQEEGSAPFDPGSIKSHFCHAYIVVRPHKVGKYFEVCVTHKRGVLENTPPYLPERAHFGNIDELSHWLMLKAVNLERAALYAPAFAPKLRKARRMELAMLLEKQQESKSLRQSRSRK